jgi:phosphopantothenoylcysteine decarboxylase/phosphopantothenate--cysteine ligase
MIRPAGPLRGKRVVVTAGPTYEDLDPVRYIGNRSSGRMGYALAAEAARRGASVALVSGPTSLEVPAGIGDVVRVRSARDMHDAVLSRAAGADVVVMAAAVADYTPERQAPQKMTKQDDGLTLVLKKTPDILADLGQQRLRGGEGPLLVGFAAETEQLLERARAKLERKHVDLIVANDVSRPDAGFDVETNAVTLVGRDGVETLPLQSKSAVAAEIFDRVERMLAAVHANPGSIR